MNEDGGESTEPEHADKTLFFGGQTNEQPGNYTVNAIDVEELRRSQRRPRPNDLATNPSQVCTGWLQKNGPPIRIRAFYEFFQLFLIVETTQINFFAV